MGIFLIRKKLDIFIQRKTLLVVLFFLVAGGFIYYQQSRGKDDIQLMEVKRQDLKSEVSASGVLTGKQSAELKFLIAGKINYLNVSVGDTVKRGQLISGLDTMELQITLQQARQTFIAKQAAAQKVEDEVKGHDKDESFEQKMKRTAAQADSNNAFDAVKAAERDLRDAVLLSPIDGIVTQVNKLSGQAVTVTDTVVQVVDSFKIYFDAEVDEADIDKISLGQKAEVTLNSNSDKAIEGIVSQIYPNTKTTSSGATVVIVRIDLTNSGVRFINNINGQVSIVLSEVSNALVIPSESLIDGDKVVVKEGSEYKEVKVLRGLEADEGIEVKDGLQEGQTVVSNPQVVKNYKRI